MKFQRHWLRNALSNSEGIFSRIKRYFRDTPMQENFYEKLENVLEQFYVNFDKF